jgi:hypothetical protein
MGPKGFITVGVLAFATGCGNGNCSTHTVVQATSADGYHVDTLELDDGHVYSARGLYPPQYPTGTTVRVCAVTSKVDGSVHYSVISTAIRGAAADAILVR